jgi:hypothetical protein
MYQSGKCCACGSGLSPYMILPKGGLDGKYYCYASDAEAAANGNKVLSKGGPAKCGDGFRARNYVHRSMEGFVEDFGEDAY